MMTSTPRRAASRSGTVLQLAVVALVAAVLIWAVLFLLAVNRHSGAAAAQARPTGVIATPESAPAPVTTRSS